jgi:hypothetical protein
MCMQRVGHFKIEARILNLVIWNLAAKTAEISLNKSIAKTSTVEMSDSKMTLLIVEREMHAP